MRWAIVGTGTPDGNTPGLPIVNGPSLRPGVGVTVVESGDDAVDRAAVEIEDVINGSFTVLHDLDREDRDEFLRAVARAAFRGGGMDPS